MIDSKTETGFKLCLGGIAKFSSEQCCHNVTQCIISTFYNVFESFVPSRPEIYYSEEKHAFTVYS